MIVHREFKQGSAEWLQARCAIPTASEFDNLLTPEFKLRTGQMPANYLSRKLAEWWLQWPEQSGGSWAMEQGHFLEPDAIRDFEFFNDTTIDRVGFCTTDDGKVGCSPDGLLGDDSGIEIKCPSAATHVSYLLAGTVPKDYLAQIHGSMWVTGRPVWKFLSYRRHFPPLLVTVERDEEIQKAISWALEAFLAAFDERKERLIALNGGIRPQFDNSNQSLADFQRELERQADNYEVPIP